MRGLDRRLWRSRHHQVVDDPTIGVQQLRVSLPAGQEIADITWDQPLERGGHCLVATVFGYENSLSHVADIENPCILPRPHVLLQNPERVLDRHLVTGEWNHLGAEGKMAVAKWCNFQRRLVVERTHCRPHPVARPWCRVPQ